jgi:hypothetical protein
MRGLSPDRVLATVRDLMTQPDQRIGHRDSRSPNTDA